MLSGENCNAVSELAEGYTYIRGRCKQLGFVNNPQRNDGRYRSGTEYEIITCIDEVDSSIDGFENHSQDICRRVSMSKFPARVFFFSIFIFIFIFIVVPLRATH